MSKVIMGIKVCKRVETVNEVQNLLTEYGCFIKTRLGVHQTASDSCSEQGLILLEFMDDADEQASRLEEELASIDQVIVKKMVF